VKGFVEAQNGTISLKNAEDSGAIFTIELNVDCLPINSLKNE
jgi:K+-sensing histidine kinase KdpD